MTEYESNDAKEKSGPAGLLFYMQRLLRTGRRTVRGVRMCLDGAANFWRKKHIFCPPNVELCLQNVRVGTIIYLIVF